MKFRVIIEQLVHQCKDCEMEFGKEKPHWEEIKREEVEINVAEKASRMIEKIIRDEGLDINSNDLRKILFAELHEKLENSEDS